LNFEPGYGTILPGGNAWPIRRGTRDIITTTGGVAGARWRWRWASRRRSRWSSWPAHIAARPPSQRKSFGYHRSEVLAALLNGLGLLLIALLVSVEALSRFSAPPEVDAGPMLAIAVAGLLANLASAWVLSRESHGGLNERGALLHVLSDALGSVATIVAGLTILATGWQAADPLLSLVTSLLIGWGGLQLLRDTSHVLMEGVPSGVELAEVRAALEALEGVRQVHDLHIWSVTSGMHAMSGHVQVEPGPTLANPGPLLLRVQALLADQFHIHHTTIQLEPIAFADLEELHLDCGASGCALVRSETERTRV
jgi:cobalt-zinc-cadmium efflux system protein